MLSVRQCPKCGLDLTDQSARTCPTCGASLSVGGRGRIWIGALLQFAFAAIFMTIFHFPKFIIVFFGVVILLGAVATSFMKPASGVHRPQATKPLSHPALFRVASLGMALCAFSILVTLLFGTVMFLDSWDRWHRYEGQPYHRSDFQVVQVYYQKHSKSTDVYARGVVEGQREWMSLQPYLHMTPRSQQELELRVPTGVMIPIYYFPNMQGRLRVQVYKETPPDEESHRAAIAVLRSALPALAIMAVILLLLIWARRACFVPEEQILLQPVGSR